MRRPDASGGWVMLFQRLYREPEYLALSTDARLLFVWSWTHPAANKIGLYRATWLDFLDALGKSSDTQRPQNDRERVEGALGELERKPLCLWDPERMLIWVVSRAKYANRSETAWHGMKREIAAVPECALRDRFVEKYGQMLKLGEEESHG